MQDTGTGQTPLYITSSTPPGHRLTPRAPGSPNRTTVTGTNQARRTRPRPTPDRHPRQDPNTARTQENSHEYTHP